VEERERIKRKAIQDEIVLSRMGHQSGTVRREASGRWVTRACRPKGYREGTCRVSLKKMLTLLLLHLRAAFLVSLKLSYSC
jgi:hypothetical protein